MLHRYHGYNEALVNRFCDLGFDIPTVIQALETSGIEKDIQNSKISEHRANEVASRLFGESWAMRRRSNRGMVIMKPGGIVLHCIEKGVPEVFVN
jgi:hypothetical protein